MVGKLVVRRLTPFAEYARHFGDRDYLVVDCSDNQVMCRAVIDTFVLVGLDAVVLVDS